MKRKPLQWDDELGVPLCDKCAAHLDGHGHAMLFAFDSVGIEHGKSAGQMAYEYFSAYHAHGHKM